MFVVRHFHVDKLAAAHYATVSSAELIATSWARSAAGASYKIHPHTALLRTPRDQSWAALAGNNTVLIYNIFKIGLFWFSINTKIDTTQQQLGDSHILKRGVKRELQFQKTLVTQTKILKTIQVKQVSDCNTFNYVTT